MGSRYDQDVPDPRQHQGAERVVDHRLVVYRQELFAHDTSQGVQPGARPAREDNPFHFLPFRVMPWDTRAAL